MYNKKNINAGGFMTLKQNAIIGQSGGPTSVINQSLAGVIEETRRHPEIEYLYGAIHGVAGMLENKMVNLLKENPRTLDIVAQTPSAALGSIRMKPTKEECALLFSNFKKLNIRYFYYIGGNDTAETTNIVDTIAREDGYDLKVFHIPKTIDNDLLVTDHCPGYGSAAKFVVQAIMGDNLDNRSLGGIKVDVIMGRHAGFLTAASVLAKKFDDDGPHLIYVPETIFDMDKFLDDVQNIYDRHHRAIIAVSEGICDKNGAPIASTGERDSHGNIQLSGSGLLGDLLAKKIRDKLGKKLRVRADTFGYLQRSFVGVYSEIDAKEARRVGQDAVKFATSGIESGSIAIKRTANGKNYAIDTFVTPLSSVAKETKSLARKYINKDANFINKEYIDYLKPLTGKLPEIARLENFWCL